MRFIATHNLRPGDKLAADLMVSKNTVLLRKDKPLSQPMISKIGDLGYQGLYIDDELSDGLDINDVISLDLRLKTKRELQLLFFSVENNYTSNVKKHIKAIRSLAKSIVDEILQNKQTMINIIDLRNFDDYTYSHSLNVTVLSVVIGTALGLNKNTIYELSVGGLIHDTGKMFVRKEVLNKPDKLTPEEFEEIKKHSELGYRYLCNSPDIPESSKMATLQHHEQFNGKGYPGGLSGESITPFARIISVADVYDALTSDRPYRKAMLPSDAIEYIMGGYGTMFDPKSVDALTKKVAPYPIGTCVRLSTGDVGIVVKNYETTSMRPMVRLIEDDKPTSKYIDLSNDRTTLNITVKDIVNL
jgi:HD-GYP domain-containing protein (c-di-GMP phosphodiesterase class II)